MFSAWKWLNVSMYVLGWSGIGKLMVHASSLPFVLTMLTTRLLSECHRLAPASATDWFNKGHAMCYLVYTKMFSATGQT